MYTTFGPTAPLSLVLSISMSYIPRKCGQQADIHCAQALLHIERANMLFDPFEGFQVVVGAATTRYGRPIFLKAPMSCVTRPAFVANEVEMVHGGRQLLVAWWRKTMRDARQMLQRLHGNKVGQVGVLHQDQRVDAFFSQLLADIEGAVEVSAIWGSQI